MVGSMELGLADCWAQTTENEKAACWAKTRELSMVGSMESQKEPEKQSEHC
jgi:hypothetical protein